MKVETAAVVTKIETVPALATKVDVAKMPRDSAGKLIPAPYVVVWPSDGIDSVERADIRAWSNNPRFTLWIVGSSYDNCQTVTELVKAKFVTNGLGVRLTITGRNTHPVRWSMPAPVQIDDSVQPPLVYNIVELAFKSDPTTLGG